MTSDSANKHQPDEPERIETASEMRVSRTARRRERMIAEIQRNRRGEYTVPTWVLVAAIAAIIGAWAALIIFA